MPQEKHYQQRKYLILRSSQLKFVLALCLLIGALVYTFEGDFFKIKKINCQINQTECSSEIKDQFSKILGQNILLVDLAQEATIIAENYPLWHKFKIDKKLPETLLVEIQIPQPRVAVSEPQGKLFYLVDDFGQLVDQKDFNPGLPQIYADNIPHAAPGQALLVLHLEEGLELIKWLTEFRLSFTYLQIKNDHLLCQLKNFQAIFSPQGDLQEQVTSLQLIINEGRIREGNFKQLDLRFEKPVIIY